MIRSIGFAAVVLVAALGLTILVLFLVNLPDLNRYLRMKRM